MNAKYKPIALYILENYTDEYLSIHVGVLSGNSEGG